jgi:hypothetical protein
MTPPTTPSLPTLKYDTRSVIAAALCVVSLFFDVFGWLLAIAGIFMLRRAVFTPGVKWALAAVALAPKILFLGVRMLSASPGLAFTIEPRTLATSSSMWSWSVLLAAAGFLIIYVPRRMRRPQDPHVQAVSPGPSQLRWVGLILIVGAAVMLLGVTDGFQRIEDAGNGRWALKHAARGAVATFTRDDVAALEAAEVRRGKGAGYSVKVGLKDGRSFSVSTKSPTALEEVRKFAATAGLPPGTVRITRRFGGLWTNAASAFTLEDCTGTYEYSDGSERSTVEFWMDHGHLEGKETAVEGQRKRVQLLKDIKISDTGEVEFRQTPYAEASQTSGSNMAFSFSWSTGGDRGRFSREGLEIGLKKYRKR